MAENKYLKEFLKVVLQEFDGLMRLNGFKKEKKRLDVYGCEAIYKNKSQYVRVSVNIHPRDCPYYWNIVLGEGSVDMPECDWNSIALWYFKRHVEQDKSGEYEIKNFDLTKIEGDVRKGKLDLEKYGGAFLKGELKLFYELRSLLNKDREPYKIYSPNDDGRYSEKIDEESLKIKKEIY